MNSTFKYAFKLRPGYGSEELLIELDAKESPDQLLPDLFGIVELAGFKLEETGDLWMNDEFLFIFSSDNGTISISRDSWDLFFILGENNQADILKLDQLLSVNPLFEKIIADYSDYQ